MALFVLLPQHRLSDALTQTYWLQAGSSSCENLIFPHPLLGRACCHQVCQVQLSVTSLRDLPDSALQLIMFELVASSHNVSKRQQQSFRHTEQC